MAWVDQNANTGYSADERGTARRIADDWWDSLCWSEELNKWLTRRERQSVWKVDILVERQLKAMQSCEAQRIDNPNSPGLTRPTHMRQALDLAKSLLAVELCEFDKNPWALSTPSGILNLRSGEYVNPYEVVGRYRMCTRVSPEQMKTPLWDDHLLKMCKGDLDIIAYLKRLAGITLIGDQNLKPHISPQLNGLGRNGKGVFLQGLSWALGDYAQFASTRLLTTTENAHTTEQAGLRGMRLVIVEEVKRINSSLLKDLTGGGMMRARRIRMDDEEFLKTWTLWFNNNGPMMFNSDVSDGLWQRVPRIDLGEGIPIFERIEDMAERIKAEAPGILQWMVDGLAEFFALNNNLETPESVKRASEIARADADPVVIFVNERYDFINSEKITASEFMRDLTEWAKATGEVSIGGRRSVYDELRTRLGLCIQQGSKGKYWIHGLKKKPISFGELSSEYSKLSWENETNPEKN